MLSHTEQYFCSCRWNGRRSQWPRGLRLRSSAARLLRLWIRIPPGAWMFVCCECCVLSGRSLCDGLITRPRESFWLWRFVVYDQETSKTRRLKPAIGLWKIQPQWFVTPGKQTNRCNVQLVPVPKHHIITASLIHILGTRSRVFVIYALLSLSHRGNSSPALWIEGLLNCQKRSWRYG